MPRTPARLSPEDALTKEQAADHAEVTQRTIGRWVEQGHLTRYVARANRLAVSRKELDRFLAGRKVRA